MPEKGVILTADSCQKLKDKLRRLSRPQPIPSSYRNPVLWPEIDIRIFEVQSAGTGEGIYDCFELQLVRDNWAGSSVDKFQPKGVADEEGLYDTVEILNLAENAGSGTALAAEDRLAAWQETDDSGRKRWVGISLETNSVHNAYCKTNATESDVMICFLDCDGTDPAEWSLGPHVLNEVINGDDSKVYRCIKPHTAVDTTTRPVSGENYAEYWAEIKEIEVYCSIHGGGNLADAAPRLLTMYKSLGYDGTVPPAWVLGTNYVANDLVKGTNSREYYNCILAHTATVDDRPSSGDDWETYWEVTKSFASKLHVVKIKGVWEAMEHFQASFDDAPRSP